MGDATEITKQSCCAYPFVRGRGHPPAVGLLHGEHVRQSRSPGGQQQRVAVARALANSPSIVLADEPTAALDSVRGRQVMELFRKVAHEQGAGVLVVTHDHRALDVFDEILEMEDGALRQPDENQRTLDKRG